MWPWRDCLTAEQCGYDSRGPCSTSLSTIRDTSSCGRADSASHHDSNSSVYSTSWDMTGTSCNGRIGSIATDSPSAARAVVPLGSTLPAALLDQFHGPRNVSASVL